MGCFFRSLPYQCTYWSCPRPARWHVSQPPQGRARATEMKAFKGRSRLACVSLSLFGKGDGAWDLYGLVSLDYIVAV